MSTPQQGARTRRHGLPFQQPKRTLPRQWLKMLKTSQDISRLQNYSLTALAKCEDFRTIRTSVQVQPPRPSKPKVVQLLRLPASPEKRWPSMILAKGSARHKIWFHQFRIISHFGIQWYSHHIISVSDSLLRLGQSPCRSLSRPSQPAEREFVLGRSKVDQSATASVAASRTLLFSLSLRPVRTFSCAGFG